MGAWTMARIDAERAYAEAEIAAAKARKMEHEASVEYAFVPGPKFGERFANWLALWVFP
jgi:hypothetical protein